MELEVRTPVQNLKKNNRKNEISLLWERFNRGFQSKTIIRKKFLIIHGYKIILNFNKDLWDFLRFLGFLGILSWIRNPKPNPKLLENRSQSHSQSPNSEKSIPIPILIPKLWDWDWDPMGLGSQCRPLVSAKKSQSQSHV